jgi:hypothetical protein
VDLQSLPDRNIGNTDQRILANRPIITCDYWGRRRRLGVGAWLLKLVGGNGIKAVLQLFNTIGPVAARPRRRASVLQHGSPGGGQVVQNFIQRRKFDAPAAPDFYASNPSQEEGVKLCPRNASISGCIFDGDNPRANLLAAPSSPVPGREVRSPCDNFRHLLSTFV